MFNDLTTPLSALETRRSGKPRDMIAPGPDADQLRRIVAAAARTPDHGKLHPWRFVIVPDARRDALAAVMAAACRDADPAARPREIEAAEQFARQAPALVVVLFSPKEAKIPQWEQQLSVGAVCMNLLHAAHALGFTGSWITGWPSYAERVRDAFGTAPERIAGFLFIGTPGRELEERPRPAYDEVVSRWAG